MTPENNENIRKPVTLEGKENRRKAETQETKENRGKNQKSKISLKKFMVPGLIILALIIAAGIFILIRGLPKSEKTIAGGTVNSYGSDYIRVSFGKAGETTAITTSMLDELDRNSKVVAIAFRYCDLSDEAIARIGSMKRIEDIWFHDCTGFTGMNSLSSLSTLKKLRFSTYSEGNTFNGGELFTSDIPQLETFGLDNFVLQGGLDFLARFQGVKTLNIYRLTGEKLSGQFPVLPALESVTITDIDLSGMDLSGLCRADKFTYLKLENDSLESISFLKDSVSLSTMYVNNNSLTSLDGVQGKERLDHLNANNNQINDISALAECSYLCTFCANSNQISDISALEGCTGLKTLNLKNNLISDAGPLAGHADLTSLNIAGNRLTDLSPVSDCENITDLNFSGNEISDISFCNLMLKLKNLRASSNQISDISPLENATQLKQVYLDNNQLSDVSVLKKSETVLELVVLDNNRLSDLSAFSGCTALKGISVNKNQLTSLSGLENSTELNYICANGNAITSISALNNCEKLYSADLGENEITDVTPLSASKSDKMSLLLQNNHIKDISPLYGMKNYVYLSLYNNDITSVKGMEAMTNINPLSVLYLGWWEGFDAVEFSKTTYYKPKLVDVPADKQVNLHNDFQNARKEAGQTMTGDVVFISEADADSEIEEARAKVRDAAGIKEWEKEE